MFKGLKCLPISATLLCCASSFIPLAKGADLFPVPAESIALQKLIKGVVKDKSGNPNQALPFQRMQKVILV